MNPELRRRGRANQGNWAEVEGKLEGVVLQNPRALLVNGGERGGVEVNISSTTMLEK